MPMSKQEATNFVLSQLAQHRNRQDIILELRRQTGGSQDQVQRFVQLVESQNLPTTAPPAPKPVSTPASVEALARPAPPAYAPGIKRVTQEKAMGQQASTVSVAAPAHVPLPAVPPSIPESPSSPIKIGKKNALDTPEMITFVINEFAKHRSRNDIIMALCEKTGSSWNEVQRFVQHVESENRQTITARQSPILIMIGVVTLVGGILLLAYTVLRTLNGYAWGLPGMPIPYLGNLTYAGTSLGMIGGGLVGTLRTLKTLVK